LQTDRMFRIENKDNSDSRSSKRIDKSRFTKSDHGQVGREGVETIELPRAPFSCKV
jgi:hypothetical protein